MANPKTFQVDIEKCKALVQLKRDYFSGKLSFEEARELLVQRFPVVTPEEFAYGEQQLKEEGVTDQDMQDRMDDLLRLFEPVLQVRKLDSLPEGHPVKSYLDENRALEPVLAQAEALLQKDKFIKNPWLEVYDKLLAYIKHITRKHNQLFPFLEKAGFDRPTAVMWAFDDAVRDKILKGSRLLQQGNETEFLAFQPEVVADLRDIMGKEETILFPTALWVLTEGDFRKMRIGEEEVGFANIPEPMGFLPEKAQPQVQGAAVPQGFMGELDALLQKYQVGKSAQEFLDVANGQLTLEQINLIYRHLPIDLTFTDENDIVKFYSDSKERIFDRSAGVIGRVMQNCHPRSVLPVVNKVVELLRTGQKDKIEFSLRKKGMLVHVNYIAVRDESGKFRGILETMQNIAPLKKDFEGDLVEAVPSSHKAEKTPGEQEKPEAKEAAGAAQQDPAETVDLSITMAGLMDKYPYLKDYFVTLNPMFKKMQNPITFAAVGRFVTLQMVAQRGGFVPEELLEKVRAEIRRHQ